MKILITGAKGFVGKELVSQCKAKGIEVLEFDLPEFDIRKREIVDAIPENLDAVVHLAAFSRDPDCKNKGYECFENNVMATLNLMNAAEAKKAKQFIFASSEWVYDRCSENEVKTEESMINIANHTSEYALSKLVSENNLRQKFQHGFCDTTVLRFGIIYGPRKEGSAVESLFNMVREKSEIEVGSLGTGRHFIHVADIAAGIIKSIGLAGFNIINLEGEKLITLGDIIEMSKKVLNKNLPMAEPGSVVQKKNPKIIEKTPDVKSVRRVSNEKAKKLLNWSPEINLEEGLNKLLKI